MGMNLYEINMEIERAFDDAVDPETGEIINEEAAEYLNNLQMAFDQKVENIGCWIKNLRAEEKALKEEKQAFEKRQKQTKSKAESLERYLASALNGQKFKTEKVAISYRKSESVNVLDVCKIPKDYVQKIIDLKPDKVGIKKAIKAGVPIEGVELVESRNIQIK